MKKQLLTICAFIAAASVPAQTPSTDWSTNQQAVFPTSPTFTAQGIEYMDAVDPNVIWVLGNDWADPDRNYNWWSRSTNGGSSFTGGYIYSVTTNPSQSDTNTYHIANLDAIDANTAWVGSFLKANANAANPGTQGSGAIHRTTNGGQTWVNMTATGMFTNQASFNNFVVFFSPSVGIAQGDPVNGEYEIWRTTNGGLSWNLMPGANIPDPLNAAEFSIVDLYYKLGSNYMWFGTNAGRIYRTADAGLTWSVAVVGAATDVLLEIAFSSPLQGITYVYNGASIDVYNTFDGGANWNLITPNGNIGYADIKHVPGTGIIASFGVGTSSYLSYTSDNGLNWTDWGSSNIQYLVGDFVDNSTGWAGSHNFPNAPNFTNIWKYTGAPLTATTTPLASFTMPGEVCITGGTVSVSTANSSSATPNPTYSWSAVPSGAVFSSATATNPSVTFSAAGSYTVALSVNNGFTTSTAYNVINVVACSMPTASFSVLSSTVCNNAAVGTNNQSTGGVPAPSYSWSASGPGILTFSPSPIAMSPSIVATPGIYTLTLMASNVLGSVAATQTVDVVNCAPMAAFFLADTLYNCNPNSIKIHAANQTQTVSGAGVNTYTWSITPLTGITAQTGPNAPNYSVTATNTNVSGYTVTLRTRNASGTSSVTAIVKLRWSETCTGLEDAEWLSGTVIYPNPTTGEVSVTLPATGNGLRLTVTNILGSVVVDKQMTGAVSGGTIDLSDMPRGVYLLTAKSGDAQVTRRIVVE